MGPGTPASVGSSPLTKSSNHPSPKERGRSDRRPMTCSPGSSAAESGVSRAAPIRSTDSVDAPRSISPFSPRPGPVMTLAPVGAGPSRTGASSHEALRNPPRHRPRRLGRRRPAPVRPPRAPGRPTPPRRPRGRPLPLGPTADIRHRPRGQGPRHPHGRQPARRRPTRRPGRGTVLRLAGHPLRAHRAAVVGRRAGHGPHRCGAGAFPRRW